MQGHADLAFGLASSVGPVPFGSSEDAVDFSLRLHGRFPTVPVTTSQDASLLAQAVAGLANVTVGTHGIVLDGPHPDPADAAAAGGSLDGPAFSALHTMTDRLASGSHHPSLAAVRVPVLGPVTVAAALQAAGLRPARSMELASALVAARAVTMLRSVGRAVRPSSTDGGAPVVAVVMCEPALVGSAHPTFPMVPSQIRSLLDPVVDALDRSAPKASLLIGVHVPGRCDWPSVIGSGVSLLCVPGDRSALGWAPQISDLLERGGRVCWGVVPVDRPIGTSADPHWRRLVSLWTSFVADGVDPMLLRLRSSFSPADGLGAFGPTQAERVMELTVAVAERVGHQAVAARLSLGA